MFQHTMMHPSVLSEFKAKLYTIISFATCRTRCEEELRGDKILQWRKSQRREKKGGKKESSVAKLLRKSAECSCCFWAALIMLGSQNCCVCVCDKRTIVSDWPILTSPRVSSPRTLRNHIQSPCATIHLELSELQSPAFLISNLDRVIIYQTPTQCNDTFVSRGDYMYVILHCYKEYWKHTHTHICLEESQRETVINGWICWRYNAVWCMKRLFSY